VPAVSFGSGVSHSAQEERGKQNGSREEPEAAAEAAYHLVKEGLSEWGTSRAEENAKIIADWY